MQKLAIVLASFMVVACASSKNESHLATQSSDKNSAPLAVSTAPVSAAQLELNTLSEELKSVASKSDYFDYNKYIVKSEYQEILQKEAAFIKAHKNDAVTLEGNADERGSEKYNFDLGKKRAASVAKILEGFGVPAKQIKIVSFGKERARLTCHEERCWKENRRVDFAHKLNETLSAS